ncbi:MAG: phosphoribosylglycinamide formyltransferase [Bacteroidales bacterium]|nr:phosphoribosylglycinamide formyltransferase [Bacteroidales bacterium]
MDKTIKIALFASGSGTNVENIANYFNGRTSAKPVCVLCNKPDAFVLERAKRLGLDSMTFNRTDFNDGQKIMEYLSKHDIDFIVLAGFLWLVPEYLINKYPGRIVNIHPALLPKFGGKGMYGMHVHEAVKQSGETETGITVHLIDGNYDKGNTVFQAKVSVEPTDSPDDIANKVHKLEYQYYPKVIEEIAEKILAEK